MAVFPKRTGLVVAALVAGALLLPFRSSEAHQNEGRVSALECERLSVLLMENMSGSQIEAARECDMVESSHDWEQHYGHLNEQELFAAVVYE